MVEKNRACAVASGAAKRGNRLLEGLLRACRGANRRISIGPAWLAALNLVHATGFVVGRGSCPGFPAGNAYIAATRPDRVIYRVRQNVAGGVWRRDGVRASRHCRAAPLDDGGRIQRNVCAVSLPAGAKHRQSVDGFGARFRGIAGGVAAFAGLVVPPS